MYRHLSDCAMTRLIRMRCRLQYLEFTVLFDVFFIQLLRRFTRCVVGRTGGFHDLLADVHLVVRDRANEVDVFRGKGLDRQCVEPTT